jgi:D-glycero-beta-D-manno-heptose 1-phosphate adenylyltransferase
MILSFNDLQRWRLSLLEDDKLVVTNGCFDILHMGHVSYLRAAKEHGNKLLVGVNDDVAVQSLKGVGRPIQPENDRVALVDALEMVNYACIFPGITAVDLLLHSRPSVWVKGGDYTLSTLNYDEKMAAQQINARIVLVPLTHNRSTTKVVENIRSVSS